MFFVVCYRLICVFIFVFFFFFKQKTAYEMLRSLVGSEMCIRDSDGCFKYMRALQSIANREVKRLDINLADLTEFFNDGEMAEKVSTNTLRYVAVVKQAIDAVIPPPTMDLEHADVTDVLYMQRISQLEDQRGPDNEEPVEKFLPDDLRRRYEVNFELPDDTKCVPLRQVRAEHVGSLVRVKGVVTRVSGVKPTATTVTYTCDKCGCEAYQEIKSRSFMPLFECPSEECKMNNAKCRLMMQTRGSKFEKFQEMRLQEVSEEVPVGHTPRQLVVNLRGENTRQCSPGDQVSITGIFLPVPVTGFRAMKMGLTAETYLEAQLVVQAKSSSNDDGESAELRRQVLEIDKTDMYDKLSQSIAPEIFGHADIKRALLLVLVGGVTKEMEDGMRIRGDLNACLMGDPGVAKSQLLKHISGIAPRGIYTTGKGSSGVGLTAAVLRDPTTNELVLEGGALVLADTGICCIDEFDKMDDADRTAIHEVMEQQTISIAKAGITTTLNARTSIVAAANPLQGRYNIKRSPEENINLPTALLSRFDLLFLLLDLPDSERDANLANHVLHVHRHCRHPDLGFVRFDAKFMRAYIEECQKLEPFVPQDLMDFIVEQYVTMRNSDADSTSKYTHASARTLLSILRQTQALARVRFSPKVEQCDVLEAIRLMEASHSSVEQEMARTSRRYRDPKTDIYEMILSLARRSDEKCCKRQDVLARVLAKSFKEEDLNECLKEYTALNVLDYIAEEGMIRLVV
eukprot:TRINITY_DN20405_c0_g1_i1.p1 TRINITY_DN20405_c0_g1~~TRINITY_DN20405_c0_g1_i1.p1  ORF type:complete len:742 (-),score=219.21 TRINITY_DN20405_c0_g1_i1:323-2548(-)